MAIQWPHKIPDYDCFKLKNPTIPINIKVTIISKDAKASETTISIKGDKLCNHFLTTIKLLEKLA
ncbi:MAG: hypothetical protein ACI9T8_000260 [Candidatus Saccharimonadales bacterium]|jgi:hypothetical protein